MRLLIFGTGRYYQNRKALFNGKETGDEVVAFIDNRAAVPFSFDGRTTYHPNQIHEIKFDKVLIMSASEKEMRRQLLDLGVSETDIWHFNYYKCRLFGRKIELYIGNSEPKRKKVALLSTVLDYNGGTIAAAYAVVALQQRGYDAWLIASEGNDEFIQEFKSYGVNIAICPAIPYADDVYLYYMQQFDLVIVNVFQMVHCAVSISKIKPTLWWIHEPSDLYSATIEEFPSDIKEIASSKLQIFVVSNIAKNNFLAHFPNVRVKTMPYGIPDDFNGILPATSKKRVIFAIIGFVCSRKGQDVFLSAIQKLSQAEKDMAEFWIIGAYGMDTFGNEIQHVVQMIPEVKMLGLLTRQEIRQVFSQIDVVVCASREDPLPIVVTEGMMHGKVCITTEATGNAAYIDNGKNGIICKTNDVESLCEKMKWILYNQDRSSTIGQAARKIYEQNFTLDIFGKRLEEELNITREMHERT